MILQSRISVIHVDDEGVERERVSTLLKKFDEVEQVGSFSDAISALSFLEANKVDIAFLDVEMKGKDGFWLAKQMSALHTKIIFITSHAGYALNAFEACALHFILKPVSKMEMQKALKRYSDLHSTHGSSKTAHLVSDKEQIAELISNYLEKKSYPKRIFISNVHKINVLSLDKVAYVVAEGTYSIFIMETGEKHTASKNLKLYAEILEQHPDFLRIHRSYIINKSHLKAIKRDGHSIFAVMNNDSELELSAGRREEIYEQLKK